MYLQLIIDDPSSDRELFDDYVIATRAAELTSLIVAIMSNGFEGASIWLLSYSNDFFGTLMRRLLSVVAIATGGD